MMKAIPVSWTGWPGATRPWRVIYRFDGEKLWILAVIDSRINVADLMLERFIG